MFVTFETLCILPVQKCIVNAVMFCFTMLFSTWLCVECICMCGRCCQAGMTQRSTFWQWILCYWSYAAVCCWCARALHLPHVTNPRLLWKRILLPWCCSTSVCLYWSYQVSASVISMISYSMLRWWLCMNVVICLFVYFWPLPNVYSAK